MLARMIDPAKLSKQQLLDLVQDQVAKLEANQTQLADRETQLSAQSKELAQDKDIIKQLAAKVEELKKDYLKLWEERFAAKSERYIGDPDQLRIDFGDTPESSDAADGLAEAAEEADLIPAHTRRKPKKKTHAVASYTLL